MTGNVLAFSFQGLLFASILYSLPFAVRPFAAAFASVDRRLIEASWCLGISRLRTFVQIACPLSWAGIVTGLVLSFAHTLGEFGVVLMVGGNIPGVTRTISIAIYDEVQAVNYRGAAMASLVLLASSFIALSVTHLINRKGGYGTCARSGVREAVPRRPSDTGPPAPPGRPFFAHRLVRALRLGKNNCSAMLRRARSAATWVHPLRR